LIAAIEKSLAELHSALGLKLNPLWAKAEIFLGVTAATIGLMIAIRVLGSASVDIDWMRFVVSMVLLVFATAGHGGHLYQSNNTLVACLAAEISKTRQ
jgi:hypothetical protein